MRQNQLSVIMSNGEFEDEDDELESVYGGDPEQMIDSNFDEDSGRLTLTAGKQTSKSKRKSQKEQQQKLRKINKGGSTMCGKDEKSCCIIF